MSEIKIRVSTHDNDTTDIDLSRNGTMLKVSLGDKKAEIDIAEFIPATMADRFLAEATYDEVTKALILTTRKEGEEDKAFHIPIGDIFKSEKNIIQVYKLNSDAPNDKQQAVPFEVPSELAGKPVYITIHRISNYGDGNWRTQSNSFNRRFTFALTTQDIKDLTDGVDLSALIKGNNYEHRTIVMYTPVDVKQFEVEYVPTPASVTLEETASGIRFTLAGVNGDSYDTFNPTNKFPINNINYNNQLTENSLTATEVTPYGLNYIAKYESTNTLMSFADSITLTFEIPRDMENDTVSITLPMVSENDGFRTFKVEAETFDELREKYKTPE
ncbi:hypothetical protein PHA51_00890 [Rodentibacter pneumotropicus]|uniref:hypothetical protein n=1 Tax=Rodentibacter pneumotropicus TaxID=758 RepID=UPI00232E242F|nr:hypothetical protein [Rodentibacter pneumotropicus]MDC2824595.1 hypothetical protein [Rodentibacter pneumotropicus]